MKSIAPGWERAFVSRLPQVLGGLCRNGHDLLRAFHRTILDQPDGSIPSMFLLGNLETLLENHRDQLGISVEAAKTDINAQQRVVSREFSKGIQKALEGAYEYCTNERGRSKWA